MIGYEEYFDTYNGAKSAFEGNIAGYSTFAEYFQVLLTALGILLFLGIVLDGIFKVFAIYNKANLNSDGDASNTKTSGMVAWYPVYKIFLGFFLFITINQITILLIGLDMHTKVGDVLNYSYSEAYSRISTLEYPAFTKMSLNIISFVTDIASLLIKGTIFISMILFLALGYFVTYSYLGAKQRSGIVVVIGVFFFVGITETTYIKLTDSILFKEPHKIKDYGNVESISNYGIRAIKYYMKAGTSKH